MEIVQAINNALTVHRLPCYFVNMILSDIAAQVNEGAKHELAMAKEQSKNEEVA
jgi:hypothetical protein